MPSAYCPASATLRQKASVRAFSGCRPRRLVARAFFGSGFIRRFFRYQALCNFTSNLTRNSCLGAANFGGLNQDNLRAA